jgi:hypothetical protein
MPNALAHRKAGEFMRRVSVPLERHATFTRLENDFGPRTLLDLYAVIADTRQIACRCVHEKSLIPMPAVECPWRRKNTRCNHQIDTDSDMLSATGAYRAGMYVLQGLEDASVPDFERIRVPAGALWELDQSIRTAFRLVLSDDPFLSGMPQSILRPELQGAATVEELEELIELARIPYANQLDAVGGELTERFELILEIEKGWRPNPELLQLTLA